MATLVTPQLAKKRAEDIFFTTCAYLMLAIVVVGFAPSYFLRGAVFAHLPSLLVHLHGAVFSSWIFLFAVQSSLIAAHKVRLHRTLGVLGGVLAALMVILGILAAFGTLHRHAQLPSFFTPASFLIDNILGILYFGVLVALALWRRNDRILHKRTLFLANTMLLPPALSRMPFMQLHPFLIGLIPIALLLALLILDLARWRRPFFATRKPILISLALLFLFLTAQPVMDAVETSRAGQRLTQWALHRS